ncbi:carotenoid oxygenase [Gigaspora margarita]|uniref:Carotenoid oxygenase n=1 Tax=Gigaspora margarita TaxID=4874 RepID=A0A8H4AVS1_GIGMA|nr:carotenoid oxygenase [Gigaspora margarita]
MAPAHYQYAYETGKYFSFVSNTGPRSEFTTYTSPTFDCFHTINSYDEGDDIITDLSQYKDNIIIFQLTINRLSASETNADKLPPRFDNGRLHRYKLCNVSNHSDSVVLNYGNDKFPNAELVFATPEDLNVELPVIDFSRYYKKKTEMVHLIIKFGTNLDVHLVNQFSPAPNAIEEEDGVITSVVLDGKRILAFY